ncbi:hypothetical protein J7E97_07450 [Streptomyces sp. ISL-66]|uniref:hypothetical protein n=1 Tax=Streptomyces sp. ISL-66 TaxID=2819186 RepID=UPI001BEB928C|nr:hypothetical protein [Streptomyces sp. ISL-66]MBT2467708.1 hypothetical protein [Streptomyces sp. ISL-66]
MAHFPFPDDLVSLKRQQIRIYGRLALQPALGTAELRRELIRLSCLISSHPYWERGGWSTAGQVELHRAASTGLISAREPAPGARSS